MRKNPVSMTLKPASISFLTRVAEINHLSRSQAADLMFDMVQDYFSDEQLQAEARARKTTDYRRTNNDRQ